MSGRTQSALEHAGPDPAVSALALAGPGIATVLAAGLGWSLGLPASPAGLALHAAALAQLGAAPALLVLAGQPTPRLRRQLRQGSLLAVTAAGILIAWLGAIPATLALPTLVLGQALVLAWLALPGLTPGTDGGRLALGCGVGLAVSIVAGMAGGRLGGDAGLLWGLACGPAIGALLLQRRSRDPAAPALDAAGWRSLLVIGGAFASGLWWDALVSWCGPGPPSLSGALRPASREGGGALLVHCAAIPVLITALIRCGAAFQRGRTRFRATLLHGGDLAAVMTAKQELVTALDRELALLVRLQALVGLALVLCAPPLVRALGLPASGIAVLCLDVVGTALLAPVLVVAMLLLAGGWRRSALQMGLVFTTLALAAALPALEPFGIPAGWGRLVGGGAALAVGLSALRRQLTDLEYETLSREPLRA